MATATIARVGDTIKLESEPQTFALRFTKEGKSVASRFPGGRVMFTCIDERKLFMNDEEASEFEHALIEKGIRKAEFISVSRVTHGRGGGFAIRVERVEDAGDIREPAWVRDAATAPAARTPSRTEALLEKSVDMARERGPAAFRTAPEPQTPQSISPAAGRLCAAMCVLIDSMAEAKAFAQRRGIDLTNEDLRCLVTTAFIQDSRGAR